ncbi:protein TIC 22-like [Striga asiatica]|uniref:Protein TIC 22-like n=1 Tax=Striga asiatica TaxID=4170 RepID=A0A5A7QN71_STRAF|nr:protein TIC 22-like [Striga asiatica]
MGSLKKKDDLLPNASNTLKTQFSNFINHINPKLLLTPFCSLFPKNNCNHALPTAEIKKRLAGIRAYKITDRCDTHVGLIGKNRGIHLLYLGEQDAHSFLNSVESLGDKVDMHVDDLRVYDTPITEILDVGVDDPPMKLVPELLQVKYAIEEIKKNSNENTADGSFSGVPVFQSDGLAVDDGKGKRYRPCYLRKEDLEYARSAVLTKSDLMIDNIKVTSLEKIIQEMKDSSISKSNNILIAGPGMSWRWFDEQNQKKR